jgi:hypothetical protein
VDYSLAHFAFPFVFELECARRTPVQVFRVEAGSFTGNGIRRSSRSAGIKERLIAVLPNDGNASREVIGIVEGSHNSEIAFTIDVAPLRRCSNGYLDCGQAFVEVLDANKLGSRDPFARFIEEAERPLCMAGEIPS